MSRTVLILAACAGIALATSSCSNSNDKAGGFEPASQGGSTAAATKSPAKNARGAIEVKLGDPVEIHPASGPLVVRFTNTHLVTDSCSTNTEHPDVTKTMFAVDVETGPIKMNQWLWPSDVYYVKKDGTVVRNFDLTDSTPCRDSVALIDVPMNSKASGSPTLDIPKDAVAIGYHLEAGAGQIDERIEWKLS